MERGSSEVATGASSPCMSTFRRAYLYNESCKLFDHGCALSKGQSIAIDLFSLNRFHGISVLHNIPVDEAMAFNTDNTIQDRFTTHWSSSSDPGAIRWAKLKRIHYEKDLYQNIRDLLGDYTGPCGEENIDINKLRAANRASDEADRRFHARDQELHTSESSTYTTADWCRDVTRGQKLRTCRYHKLMLDTISQGVNIRILKLEKELRRKADPEKANLIIKMKMNDPDLQEMLVLVERMRILVVEEAGAGWDWKEGCKAQMVVRERQKEFDGVWGKYIEFVPDKVAIWNWSLKLKA